MKRLLLIVVFAAASATVVLAQANSSSNANQGPSVGQQSVATVDYLWRISELGSSNALSNIEYLFPYSAWYLNPSAITGFKKKTVLTYVTYSGNGSTTTATQNTTATGGVIGGTDVKNSTSRWGAVDLASFIPIGNNMVAGAEGYFSGWSNPMSGWGNTSSEVQTNYNANPQNLTTDYSTSSGLNWQGVGNFGMPLGPLDFGANIVYNGQFQPAKNQFTKYTDKYAAGGQPYYAVGTPSLVTAGPYNDTNTTDLSGRLGVKMPSPKLTLGMSAGFGHNSSDYSKQYIAVDENGDGYAETIVPYSTYATSTAAWGLGDSTYSNVSASTSTTLQLFPSVSYRFTPSLALILDGYWIPLKNDSYEGYTHTTSTDKSDYSNLTKSGLDNFQAIAGVDFKPLTSLDLRAGVGVGHSTSSFSQKSLDTSGNSTYSSGNTNHYNEVTSFAAGTQPYDGEIINDTGNQPTTTVSTTYLALLSVSWSPFRRVTFFAGSAFSDSSVNNTYNIYDSTTSTVWTQTSTSGSGWAVNSLIGMALQLTKDFSLSLTTNDLSVNGNLNSSTNAVPISTSGTKSSVMSTASNNSSSSIGATVSGVVTF